MNPDKTLAEILAQRMRIGQPMPVSLALAIVRQVCDSLEYAHNLCDPTGRPLGIVHRDVSPANIVVSELGVATLVASNAQHGAFAYMAPEYVATGAMDARADLFGLGVVVHEMLTNRSLFAGRDDRDTLDRVWGLPIPPPSSLNPQVSPDLDGIVLAALSRDPAYRWQNAAALREGMLVVAERLGIALPAVQDPIWRGLFAAPIEPSPAVPGPEVWVDDTGVETRIQPVDPRLLEMAQAAAAAPAAPAPPPPAPVVAAPPPPAPVRPVHVFEPELGPEPTQIGAMPLISFGNTPLVSLVGETAPRTSAPSLPPPVATFVESAELARANARRLQRMAIITVIAMVAVFVVAGLV